MRTFGTDKPEFFTFKLEGFDETYSIPLMASLPVQLSSRFADIYEMGNPDDKNNAAFRLQVDILAKYLPADAMEAIDAATMGAIFDAYIDASSEQGAEAGE